MKRIALACLLSLGVALLQGANRPDRVEWFRDLGLGLFIHWSLDSQLTSVISHSMVGADEAYLERYVTELPRSFNPQEFDPREWARVARLAGFRYVVFTAKHHSGFCMFETSTTDFNIMNTPFGRDTAKEIADAFRAEESPSAGTSRLTTSTSCTAKGPRSAACAPRCCRPTIRTCWNSISRKNAN